MIHLCLVSAQPLPNLTPALDSDPNIKPERVILAVSPQMKTEADDQEAVLKRHHIPVERLELHDAWNLPDLLNRFIEFLDSMQGQEIVLNATGGTKPMAIAAQEAFRMAERPVFYVHKGDILWLDHDKGKTHPAVHLDSRLKLEPFLQAHGFTVRERATTKIVPEWRAFAAELAAEAGSDNGVAALNAIASMAEGNDNVRAQLHSEAQGLLAILLQKLYAVQVISYYDDRKVEFASETARQFANGGWLEHHVFSSLSNFKDQLQDYAMNLVVSTRNGSKNELDAALLQDNKLTIVECKTRRYSGSTQDSAVSALYKLDSLTKLGGLTTKGLIVSFMRLPDYIVRRAKDLRISICQANDLRRLHEKLKDIMNA